MKYSSILDALFIVSHLSTNMVIAKKRSMINKDKIKMAEGPPENTKSKTLCVPIPGFTPVESVGTDINGMNANMVLNLLLKRIRLFRNYTIGRKNNLIFQFLIYSSIKS